MILIHVKSDFMDVKRQFETDKEAERYLHTVNKLHDTQRRYLLSRKPIPPNLAPRLTREWLADEQRTILPLKIEIINTEHNQLNMLSELMKSHDNYNNIKNITAQ